MGLLSRFSKLALLLFVLFALTSALGTWSPHSSGSWLSVTSAWATSPDETLNPPPEPPGKNKSAAMYGQPSAQRGTTPAVATRTQTVSVRTHFERLAIVWRFILASVLRF